MLRLAGNCIKFVAKRHLNYRCLATQTNIQPKVVDLPDPEWNNCKPYSEVPGPSIYQLITRNLKNGKYFGLEMNDLFRSFYHEYGSFVKIPGFFGKVDVLFCFDAVYFEKIFRSQGPIPHRLSISTLEHHRRNVRPEVFKGMTGLVTDQGESWFKLRSTVNPVMLKPKNVFTYIPVITEVSQDFVTKIKRIRNSNNEMPNNFATELSKWSLESVAAIALDQRIGVLMPDILNKEGQAMVQAVKTFFDLGFELEFKPSIWKYYETKQFKQLMGAYDIFTNVIGKYVEDALQVYEHNLKKDGQRSVLQQLLEIDRDCAILMANDFIIAGIDTTTSALSGLLYHLSTNLDKQEILRKEIDGIFPDKSVDVTVDKLANMPYFRASLKESLRLSPVVSSYARTSNKDMTVGPYRIPKNVNMVMTNVILNYDDDYYPQNEKYIPERWLKGNETDVKLSPKKSNPFVFTPFGYGVRSCIGKRYAELEMGIVVIQLLKNFRLEWHQPPLKYYGGLINYPKDNLKFKIVDI